MGFFKKAFNTINKIASNPIVKSVGGTALPANTGDQGPDGIAILEAMLQRQARAQWRGFLQKAHQESCHTSSGEGNWRRNPEDDDNVTVILLLHFTWG